MASKIRIETTEELCIACASGSVEGDIVRNGFIVGTALRDRDSNGYTTIKIPRTYVIRATTVSALSLIGSAGSGSAIALGDKLYIDTVTPSQAISKDSNGVFLGYALGVPNTTTGGYASGTQITSGLTSQTCDILAVPIGS